MKRVTFTEQDDEKGGVPFVGDVSEDRTRLPPPEEE